MNQESTMVSIIVPVYNTEKYLDSCVHSLCCQSFKDIEILLIDDGSTDSCPRKCDEYTRNDSRIRVIHKTNGGLSSAREAGIQNARGKYMMVVDSDDWIEPDTIEKCIQTIMTNESDCVMFGYIREYPGKSIETPLFSNSFNYDKDCSEQTIHRRIVGMMGEELCEPQRIDSLSSVCMKLYSSEAARKGRIVSERIVGTSEDTIFNLYALDNCRISYINRCFYHYRKTNAQSITTMHKPDLADKWDVMYGEIEAYINGSGNTEEYRTPFLNRVACGMIGLGLNEVGSSESLGKKATKIRHILNKPLYREAFRQLDISHCGMKWKLFFLLCKAKAAFLLTVLLEIMNYLRSRVTA